MGEFSSRARAGVGTLPPTSAALLRARIEVRDGVVRLSSVRGEPGSTYLHAPTGLVQVKAGDSPRVVTLEIQGGSPIRVLLPSALHCRRLLRAVES